MIKKFILFVIVLVLIFGGVFLLDKHFKNNDTRKKFTFWSIQLKPIYEKQINKIILEFERKHPDYKVVWVDIPIQEAQKRTLASILSSSTPDLINLNPEFSYILAQKNALLFFDESELVDFHSGLVDRLKYKNKIYGIPFYATSAVTLYNKNIFDKCGIEFVKSYDELYKIAPQLKSCSNIAPFVASLNEGDTLYKILNKYNVEKFKTEIEKEKTIQIYSLFNEMYKNKLIPEDTLTINHREMIEKYMSNQALVVVTGSNFIKMVKQNAPDIYAKSAIANQLVGDNKKYDVSLMNLVIPKKSSNKELAREFAFTLTNAQNQLELAKKTNVLPANKNALLNDYFKVCSYDLEDKSRCVSVEQLDNLMPNKVEILDKKSLNEVINRALEEILLDKKSDLNIVKIKINKLFPYFSSLVKQ